MNVERRFSTSRVRLRLRSLRAADGVNRGSTLRTPRTSVLCPSVEDLREPERHARSDAAYDAPVHRVTVVRADQRVEGQRKATGDSWWNGWRSRWMVNRRARGKVIRVQHRSVGGARDRLRDADADGRRRGRSRARSRTG